MITTKPVPNNLIRWHYLWYVGLSLAIMLFPIASHYPGLLNFVRVFCGLLWTGIDPGRPSINPAHDSLHAIVRGTVQRLLEVGGLKNFDVKVAVISAGAVASASDPDRGFASRT
jgi:hypothetical protein